MNCEMAQKLIALAALAPAHTCQPASARQEPENSEGMPGSLQRRADPGEPLVAKTAGADAQWTNRAGVASPMQDATLASPALDPDIFTDCEVAESELLALEEHLAVCRECQADMASTAAFYRALSLTGEVAREAEPTPSLLARARLCLDATLDNHAHQSAFAHLLQQLSFSAGRLRASPGLASGLLLLGLTVGGYGGFRAGHAVHTREQGVQFLEHVPAIADVSSIVRQPDSERVEVHFDRLEPDTFSGTLDDPTIRRLLMLAMQNGADISVRTNSFDLLAGECRQGHGCNGGPLREALLKVLHTDRSPQVRLEALQGLEPYIAEDMQVRDAVVRAMMMDSNAEVRIEAIRLLTPVEVDSSVRQALHTVASHDGDPLIRDASQQMLNGMPVLQ